MVEGQPQGDLVEVEVVERVCIFPGGIEGKLQAVCQEFGIDTGKALTMAVDFLHHAYEVRKGGEQVAVVNRERTGFRRIEPVIFTEKYGEPPQPITLYERAIGFLRTLHPWRA